VNGTRAGEATIPAPKCACGHYARIDEVTTCRFCDCAEHRAQQGYEPQTPPDAEARLQAYSSALEEATAALGAARDAELEAENARDDARRRAQFSPDCPPVGVFDGIRTTAAYQQAWIEEQIKGEEQEYRLKKAARRAAADHLNKLSKQARFQQSITASVREQYRGQWGGQ